MPADSSGTQSDGSQVRFLVSDGGEVMRAGTGVTIMRTA